MFLHKIIFLTLYFHPFKLKN